MGSELYGAAAGDSIYQDQQIRMQQLAQQKATGEANIRQSDAAAALAQAQTQNFAAGNKRADDEAARKRAAEDELIAMRKRLAAIAQGRGVGGEQKPSSSGAAPTAGGSEFDDITATMGAQIRQMLAEGRIDEAHKAMPAFTNGLKDVAQARLAGVQAREAAVDIKTKNYEFVSKLFSGVNSQEGYASALMQLAANPEVDPKDLAKMPKQYDPKLVARMIAGSAAAKQKADQEREALRLGLERADKADAQRDRELRRDLEKRRLELQTQAEQRRVKAGDAAAARFGVKTPGAPKPRELAIVEGELMRRGIKVNPKHYSSLVNDITEEVLDRTRANPGLNWGEAAGQIAQEMKADGRLSDEWYTRKDAYEPEGKTPGRALPLPKPGEALKDNTHYTASTGEVRLWKDSKWHKTGAGK